MSRPDPLWDEVHYGFLQKSVAKNEVRKIRDLEVYIDKLGPRITRTQAKRVLELLSGKGCEKSYFAAFLRTCDVSAAEMLEQNFFSKKEREETLVKVLRQYKRNRSRGIRTDENSLQAYNDAQTAKRRSSTGETKIINISGLHTATSLSDLNGKIAKVNKRGGLFSLSAIKKIFGITVSLNKEGKVPDCIARFGNDIFLIEAKHVRRRGGAQNGSLSELIAFANLHQPRNDFSIHFVSFLDGSYPKYLAVSESKEQGTKLERQKFQIVKTLRTRKGNYFVGTAGLKKIFADL